MIEYHHMLGYSVTGHVAEEMMALCPKCHHLATVGALDLADQRKLKRLPYNRKNGYASGQLWTKRDVLMVQVGTNLLVGPGYKLIVDDKPLLSVKIGDRNDLLMSLTVYDDRLEPVMIVEDNEWILGAELVTDFVAKPLYLRLDSKYLEAPLKIDARQEIIDLQGSLRYGKHGWDIAKLKLDLAGAGYAFVGMAFFDSGFLFDTVAGTWTLARLTDGGIGDGTFVALDNASSRKEWAAKALLRYRDWKRGHIAP